MARGKGEGSITKKTRTNKDGTTVVFYEGQVSVGFDESGKRIRKTVTAATKAEVTKKMRELSVSVEQGNYLEPSQMTVKQWLELWLDEYNNDIKPLTLKQYKGSISTHIVPAIGKQRLQKLTAPAIQKLYNQMTKDGFAPNTVKNTHRVLHKALGQARKLKYIRENPSEDCILPRKEKPTITVLDDDTLKEFIKLVSEDRYAAYFKFILFSGLRKAEALGLRWKDVDFKSNTITVNGQLQQLPGNDGEYTFVSTKTDRTRKITLSAYAMEILKEEQRKQFDNRTAVGEAWKNTEGYVFVDEVGESFKFTTLFTHFKKIADAMGMPEMTIHDLRHSYATLSLQTGCDIKTLQSNLGHSSSSITLDIYSHSLESMKQTAADKMQDYIQNTLKQA